MPAGRKVPATTLREQLLELDPRKNEIMAGYAKLAGVPAPYIEHNRALRAGEPVTVPAWKLYGPLGVTADELRAFHYVVHPDGTYTPV